ncbi:MAG: hypothetical protein D6681_12170, partial [Calditrichaeota bacterium]
MNSTDLAMDVELRYRQATGTPCVTRGPYLQSGAYNRIVIRWRTDTATDSRVRYGTDPNNLHQIADDATVTTEHEITLTGLTPSTRYYYSVGSSATVLSGGADHFFITAPLPGTRKKIRLWVLGDSGTGNKDVQDLRDSYLAYTDTVHTDLFVMLGDNAYKNGSDDEYQVALFEMFPTLLRQTVLWPAFGNHDAGNASSTTQTGVFYDIFTLPKNGEAGGVASGTEAYYAFNYGNIHFVCLNSHDIDRSTTGAMLTWLQNDLTANSADWTIAFWHHPPYTKGSHDSDVELQLIEMRQNAVPILESNGVDLVLTGHSHSYERSYLLNGHYGSSGTLTGTMILDNGDGRIDGNGAYTKPTLGPVPNQGAVYAVVGSSGHATGGPLNHPAMYISLNQIGGAVVDVDSNRLDFTFLDKTGARQDYFTIIKGSSDPGLPVELSTFYSKAGDGEITLFWVTQSELHNQGFEVFRSHTSQGPYRQIASFRTHPELEGAGNSNVSREYRFVDRFLINGKTYWYRLESVDFSGQRHRYGPIHLSPISLNTIPIDPGNVPERFALYPAFPNPFNSGTTLRFDLPSTRQPFHRVELTIHDVQGRRIRTLVSGNYAPGSYGAYWDGTDDRGTPVASGMFFYLLRTREWQSGGRM